MPSLCEISSFRGQLNLKAKSISPIYLSECPERTINLSSHFGSEKASHKLFYNEFLNISFSLHLCCGKDNPETDTKPGQCWIIKPQVAIKAQRKAISHPTQDRAGDIREAEFGIRGKVNPGHPCQQEPKALLARDIHTFSLHNVFVPCDTFTPQFQKINKHS